ncbi:MAG: hypothetical protein WC635_05700 [Bacteriovorax sp.]|jgi:hypothetical protein
MKKFLLTLIVVSSLVSCGKDNKVGSATSPLSTTSPISTINADGNFQSLGSAIVNNTFPQNVNYYTEYHFGTLTNTCVTKDGWFGIDYQSCSTSVTNETTVIQGNSVDEKRAELTAILSKTVVFQSYGSISVLRTTDNFTYHIDRNVPMKANPVYKLNNADGKAVKLLYIR